MKNVSIGLIGIGGDIMNELVQQYRPEKGRLIKVETDPKILAAYREIHQGALSDPDALPSTPKQLQEFGLDRLEKRNADIIKAGGDPQNVQTQAEIMVSAIADPYSPPITDQEMDELVLALRQTNRAKYRGGGWDDPHLQETSLSGGTHAAE
ncbi:MAG: hypothetical protein AAF603_09675 [Pseudomonadota bacterium]